jgi:hypothetical protein
LVCVSCADPAEKEAEVVVLDEDEIQFISELKNPFAYFFDQSYLPIDYEWDGLLDESYLAAIENVKFKTKTDLKGGLEEYLLYKFPVESSADTLVQDIHTRNGGACNSRALKLYSATETEWRCVYSIRLPFPQKGRPDPLNLSDDEEKYWLEVVKGAGLRDLSQLASYLNGPNFELDLFEIDISVTEDGEDLIEAIDVLVEESGSDQLASAAAAAATVE